MATDPGTLISSTRPVPERDPARRGRAAFLVVSLLLLWPLLVYTEFRPWEMLDARSLRVTARFLAGFVPPALNADSWRRLHARPGAPSRSPRPGSAWRCCWPCRWH